MKEQNKRSEEEGVIGKEGNLKRMDENEEEKVKERR